MSGGRSTERMPEGSPDQPRVRLIFGALTAGMERALSLLGGREQRWDLYRRLATRAGVDLEPPELARLGERAPLTVAGWHPDQQAELQRLVDRFARDPVSEIPTPA